MDVSAQDIKQALLQAIKKDQLVLPTLPEIALQVREAAANPDTDIKKLQSLLQNDASLSARVVRVANSPLVRGHRTIDNLPAALSRLGVTYSCNLALGLAMEQMFQATNEVIDTRLREVWSQSTEVAAIANVLAQHYTNLEPDQATLAGLTHQIGILPILTYAEENEELLMDENQRELDKIIVEISPMIGERILQEWKFPEALASVPTQHLDILRNSPHPDYADVVIVARLQSHGFEKVLSHVPEWDDIPAFAKLGLGSVEENLELDNYSEEIAMAANFLQ
ncbi:MAG: HD-like signal output (HDOD) protein [Pseudohongiellaceae bacterium]|jgi:HD-like signal output (HDOD) protein